MNYRHQARAAFTLIELLVVIAIIAVLMGLLLPAVQKVRESAARAQCASQMKQLALACFNYNDTYKVLPANYYPGDPLNKLGGILTYNTKSNVTAWNTASWSWIAMILPYIEQGNLYTSTAIGKKDPTGLPITPFFSNTTGLHPALAFSIPLLRCPSDPDYGIATWKDRGDFVVPNANPQPIPVAISNYKGVAGSNWGGTLQTSKSQYLPDWVSPSDITPNPLKHDGMDLGNGILFRSNGFQGKIYTLLSITDGTSNTFLIGESLPSKSAYTGGWAYANNVTGTCAIPPNAVSLGLLDYPNNYSFHSQHPGGVNMAYCDGSVHFITNDVGPTYQYMATIKGGEPVVPPQ
jgi:prepilin-type N-terminal cleavage/methylation domain-containing protein/prepilin-type processing-associated H-X9-DG protein